MLEQWHCSHKAPGPSIISCHEGRLTERQVCSCCCFCISLVPNLMNAGTLRHHVCKLAGDELQDGMCLTSVTLAESKTKTPVVLLSPSGRKKQSVAVSDAPSLTSTAQLLSHAYTSTCSIQQGTSRDQSRELAEIEAGNLQRSKKGRCTRETKQAGYNQKHLGLQHQT